MTILGPLVARSKVCTTYVRRMKRPAKTLPTNSNGTENNEAVVIESKAVDKKKPAKSANNQSLFSNLYVFGNFELIRITKNLPYADEVKAKANTGPDAVT